MYYKVTKIVSYSLSKFLDLPVICNQLGMHMKTYFCLKKSEGKDDCIRHSWTCIL